MMLVKVKVNEAEDLGCSKQYHGLAIGQGDLVLEGLEWFQV